MATKIHQRTQDRMRVSSESHEIAYTGDKVAGKAGATRRRGKRAVKAAKSETGRQSRRPVERRAEKIASRAGGNARNHGKRAPSSRTKRPAKSRRGGDRSQHLSHTTIDHDEIRRWAEERGAHPAAVRRTNAGRRTGIVRLDFPGYSGAKSLEPIDWDEFFEKFDNARLALVYQDHTAAGERSNFNKLVKRR